MAGSRCGTLCAAPRTLACELGRIVRSRAQRAGSLSMALDAATSARASNSLEKMLCHQLAALHKGGMELMSRLEQSLSALPPVEAARLTNAAARLCEAFQSGCLVQQKLKTGGQQRVLVQHQQVNVGQGAQAVVAGRIDRRRRTRVRRNNRNNSGEILKS